MVDVVFATDVVVADIVVVADGVVVADVVVAATVVVADIVVADGVVVADIVVVADGVVVDTTLLFVHGTLQLCFVVTLFVFSVIINSSAAACFLNPLQLSRLILSYK
jgi:ADP-glucose pyrophosphorylase